MMVEAYAEHADDGLEILGILSKDLPDGARKFASDMEAEWPILNDTEQAAWDDYVVSGLPTSYFVDGDGVVRAFSLGGFTEEGLAVQLERILPEDAA